MRIVILPEDRSCGCKAFLVALYNYQNCVSICSLSSFLKTISRMTSYLESSSHFSSRFILLFVLIIGTQNLDTERHYPTDAISSRFVKHITVVHCRKDLGVRFAINVNICQ